MTDTTEIRPQPGPQTMFFRSSADIVIYGGAAGGGKTWALLLECLRHIETKGFGAVIFRRTSPQITNEGGLWDESTKFYPFLGAEPVNLEWRFPNVNTISFSHLQYDKNVHDWQGSQIPLICFDELCHFTENQFFYMLSRNRSMCGVKPYVRATCNPDADSWVAEFIAWWIDQDTGLAIPERGGKVRYFVRLNGEIHWSDNRETLFPFLPKELPENVEPKTLIKSVTFVPSSVYDNKKLLETNPEYLGNLMSLTPVERERLLAGNWKVRPAAGKVFNRAWFGTRTLSPSEIPPGGVECRFWDFAATEETVNNPEPCATASVLMRYVNKRFYVLDVTEEFLAPSDVEETFLRLSRGDLTQARKTTTRYKVRWEVEPGSAGKRESARLVSLLAGVDAGGTSAAGLGDKFTRARPLGAQAQAGNVSIMQGDWNERFLRHMHNQPQKLKDIMDAAAGAFNELADTGDCELLTD